MECQPAQPVTVSVNGEVRTVPAGTTVGDLIGLLGLDPERVAVEVNRCIVRRPQWPEKTLGNNAEVEIVQFVGGG